MDTESKNELDHIRYLQMAILVRCVEGTSFGPGNHFGVGLMGWHCTSPSGWCFALRHLSCSFVLSFHTNFWVGVVSPTIKTEGHAISAVAATDSPYFTHLTQALTKSWLVNSVLTPEF
jgi:hypothetical protein